MAGRKIQVVNGRAVETGTGQAIGFRPGDPVRKDTSGRSVPPTIDRPDLRKQNIQEGSASVQSNVLAEPGQEQSFLPPQQQGQQPTEQPKQGAWNWFKNKINEAWGSGMSIEQEQAITGEVGTGNIPNPLYYGALAQVGIMGTTGTTTGILGKGINTFYKTAFEKGKILSKGEASYLNYWQGGGSVGSGIAQNAKTYGLVTKTLVAGGLIYIAKEAWDAIVFGKFQIIEGMDKLGYARSQAVRQGLTEEADQLGREIDILGDFQGSVLMNIPWLGSQLGTIKNKDAAKRTNKTWDLISEDDQKQLSGVSEDEIWAQRRAEQEASEIRIIDYYNEQRAIADAAASAARSRQNEEEALFWLEYKKKTLELERLEREEQAAFWLEYLKTKLRLQADSGRSNLNFGMF